MYKSTDGESVATLIRNSNSTNHAFRLVKIALKF